ncbi:adenosine kinase [Coniosporium apollinis CBS 100218]|uniref:Adenosine kinase n=1 Tax=Coniosporium apollinis (strain CBS 100218) TaxID=1168221 RepID=R7YJW1_CONA1|nr:adenosine kinase [Coniosporium apollinis CBS 100218]EON62158.1 adenosine kinase [Coniosporium apollinis CBS 100218]
MASGGNFELLCLENPLLDIQGKGTPELLEKYGMKPNDAILAEEKHMGLYEDLLQNHDAKIIAGGAAQNTARGAQYILPPNSVLYIGCVGRDSYAEQLQAAVAEAGVRVEYRYDDEQPTGRCGVIITGHERSMCTDLAAANCYKLEHLKQPEIWKLVEQAEVFYVGGYHLTVCVPAVMALAEEAAAKNKIFALSLSAPFIPQFFKEQLDQTAPYWDYVIGNEMEAASYAESHGLPKDDLTAVAKAMACLPKKNTARPRTVVITQGTDPTIVAIGKGEGEVEVKTFDVHAIGKEQINDTNGAGDAFAGGFMAGIVQGKPLETCVDMGHWLAKLSIQELGPSYPSPKQTYTHS